MGRRRALVLLAVHLAICVHIVHGHIAEQTFSPVEPSEAMYTLRDGAITVGFLFFATAIAITLVVGRYFCGWACHMVALQDGCAWLLRRVGIRPKPFRARLLGWMPLAFAFLMFGWPPLAQWLASAALPNAWPAMAHFLHEPAGFRAHTGLITSNLWETFPSVWIAIPFLFVCGFATIYFLGAKGFCTYACPYGALFAIADRAAPIRVVVDPNACASCGVCTSVCASNVRVHEEVATFGAVVDSNCMRSMDCVSACPSTALSIKATTPPLLRRGARPKRMRLYNFTIIEELATLACCALTFVALRGLYGIVPMLFAAGMSICLAPFVVATLQLRTKPDVRLFQFQLKRAGRVRIAGVLLLFGIAASGLFVTHSLAVQSQKARGDWHLAQGNFAQAQAALDSIQTLKKGGFALAPTPGAITNAALACAQQGDFTGAESRYREALAHMGQHDWLLAALGQTLIAQHRTQDARALYRDTLDRNPHFQMVRTELVRSFEETGEIDEAAIELAAWAIVFPEEAASLYRRAAVMFDRAGQPDTAATWHQYAKDAAMRKNDQPSADSPTTK